MLGPTVIWETHSLEHLWVTALTCSEKKILEVNPLLEAMILILNQNSNSLLISRWYYWKLKTYMILKLDQMVKYVYFLSQNILLNYFHQLTDWKQNLEFGVSISWVLKSQDSNERYLSFHICIAFKIHNLSHIRQKHDNPVHYVIVLIKYCCLFLCIFYGECIIYIW